MRQKTFWITASCVVAVIGLRPVFSSGAAPTSKEKVIYSFTGGADGGQPMSDLTIGADGNLYGTTQYGGTGTACGGCGTVFELKRAKDGWKEEVLYSFVGYAVDGAVPRAGVIFDSAGNLYGTTGGGGSNNSGTVFKLSPDSHGSWKESILHSFGSSSTDGANPQSDLVLDAQGNLYGTASEGGSGGKSCSQFGCGTVFELMPQAGGSWTETTIHIFTDADGDGATPSSGVVLDSEGGVYGATAYGGLGSCKTGGFESGVTLGCGTIYKATRSLGGTWEETVLYSFARGDGLGVNPSSGLILDQTGHMLAATSAGGNGIGAIFELLDSMKKGWQQRVLYRFYGNPDGKIPAGRLVTDANGDLFGVTQYGGRNRVGVLFELRLLSTGWKETVLHSFAGSIDGSNPQAGVVLDSHGHLYGTTPQGGAGTACDGGCGTVYEVTP